MINVAMHPIDICPWMEDGCPTVIVHSTKFFGQSQITVHPVRKKLLRDAPHPGG